MEGPSLLWKTLRQLRQAGRSVVWHAVSHLKAVRVRTWLNQIEIWLRQSDREGSAKFVVNSKRALIFAPHQDDETFGCGGLIALKCSQDVPVKVVFLTDGSQSHGSQSKAGTQAHQPHILKRRQEAEAALAILGVPPTRTHFLNFQDGSLSRLNSEHRRDSVERLAELLQDFVPEEVYLPHHQDRHPDHEATYTLVIEALQLAGLCEQVAVWQYPIWYFWDAPLGFNLRRPKLNGIYGLSIDAVREQKQRAMAVYASQTGDAQFGVLPPGFLEQFIGSFELFFQHHG
jgi:N-acetylglucosamine malate deacetylase 1